MSPRKTDAFDSAPEPEKPARRRVVRRRSEGTGRKVGEELNSGMAERRAGIPEFRRVRPGRSGNLADVEWIQDQLQQGWAREVDAREIPRDVFYDVKYIWDFPGSAVMPDWWSFYMRGDRRCQGSSFVRDENGRYILDEDWQPIRRPCMAPPMREMRVCGSHGGNIPIVRAAAAVRLAMASERAADTLVSLLATGDEDGRPIEPAQRIRAAKEVLDRAGIGPEVMAAQSDTPGYQHVLADMFGSDASDVEAIS